LALTLTDDVNIRHIQLTQVEQSIHPFHIPFFYRLFFELLSECGRKWSMNSSQALSTSEVPTVMEQTDLEPRIREFGVAVFEALGKEQPSAFNKNFWSGRIMEWSMTQPEFKTNMFRLVDVLPTLRSSEAVARHVNEYLGEVGAHIHGLVDWGVNVKPNSIRAKLTSALVRKGVRQMASQFIAGETPDQTLKALKRIRRDGLCFTVDLLGEYSVSEVEAMAYLDRYLETLEVFGKQIPRWNEAKPLIDGHPGDASPICISVKLSAMYSQCAPLNFDRSVEVLSDRLAQIARKAKAINAQVYVDAEDTANNPIIYEAFKRVYGSAEFKDVQHPGIVLQVYCKEAEHTLYDLIDFARKRGAPIAVRLVKGAYWDFETIVSAQNHWPSPLYRLKESSDASFEKLSRILIDHYQLCLPAFGSHNIRSLSHACCYAEEKGLSVKDFELQMLFGMAEPIARAFASKGYLVRLYVPQGEMVPGMGYLVRRLLENSSNESFLRHTFYESDQIEALLRRPEMRDGLQNGGEGC
jgi:RHH-type proline utilization regulon transcriptional repressor/proline dehydrogenase/delta 1-pyrroline-5-carboxylate dehydrogenase